MSFGTLLTGENEQLGIGGQHFPHGILKLSSGLDPLAHLLDPRSGDTFVAWFSIGHEAKDPSFMSLALSTMAVGLATTSAIHGERPGQEIRRDGKALECTKLALAPTRRLWALRFGLHLEHSIILIHMINKTTARIL